MRQGCLEMRQNPDADSCKFPKHFLSGVAKSITLTPSEVPEDGDKAMNADVAEAESAERVVGAVSLRVPQDLAKLFPRA